MEEKITSTVSALW